MPVMPCQEESKPGWKWGESGHCYPYTKGDKDSSSRARGKAQQQGDAIHANERLCLNLRSEASKP